MVKELLGSKDIFKTVKTPDFTINSRLLLRDMIATAIKNGLELSLGNKIKKIDKRQKIKHLSGSKEDIHATKVALCSGAGIKYFSNVNVYQSFILRCVL